MKSAQSVFVDTGAWIALALTRDPYHSRATEAWEGLQDAAALLFSSVPVVLETFTFLDRNARRDVALSWKDSLLETRRLRVVTCAPSDLQRAWSFFRRRELHKLSAVDATSFVIMEREGIRTAFTFDHHFSAVGFKLVG